jgi:hypothetical protein
MSFDIHLCHSDTLDAAEERVERSARDVDLLTRERLAAGTLVDVSNAVVVIERVLT